MKKMVKRFYRTVLAVLVALPLAGGMAVAQSDYAGLKEVAVFGGTGEYGEENGSLQQAAFRTPKGLALLPDGSLLVADTDNHLIRILDGTSADTFAGVIFDINAVGNPLGGMLDGEAGVSVFQSPAGLAVDGAGNVYVADTGNHAIRKIDVDGNVTTLAGSPIGVRGYADGLGPVARFRAPAAVAAAADGTLYVADTLNHVIRKVEPNGNVTTLNARSERVLEVFDGLVERAGDYRDGPLSEALFNEPAGLALDGQGNLYVSDSGNQRIRYIDFAAGTVTTVAGGGEAGESDFYVPGDYADGAAADARFDAPKGLAVTPEGGLLVADSGNHAIRLLQDGTVFTVVGNDNASPGKRNGTEATARLSFPTDVALDGDGRIYVADALNNQVRLITDYRLPEDLADDGSIQVVADGHTVSFDAEPVLRSARVLVPVRAIAETLGYDVQFEDEGRVILAQDDVVVTVPIGGTEAEVVIGNVSSVTELDVAAFIEQDRTYVPIRFISEALRKQVDWVGELQTVVIR